MNEKKFALIDFVDLSSQELEMVLGWRNHDNVRRWMYKQHIITKQEHKNFIKMLKTSKTKKNFLVKKENEYLGVITFDNLDKDEIYFGIYANPFLEVLGVGRILDKLAIEYTFKTLKKKKLILEVMVDNAGVINLHKKFNFKEVCKKITHGFEVYVIEIVLGGGYKYWRYFGYFLYKKSLYR